jgi:hypothetical protein
MISDTDWKIRRSCCILALIANLILWILIIRFILGIIELYYEPV